MYALEAGMQGLHDSCGLVHRIPNHPPLDQPSRLVSAGEIVAGKAVTAITEADEDFAVTAEDKIGKVSKEDPQGAFCRMLSTLHARLTAIPIQ